MSKQNLNPMKIVLLTLLLITAPLFGFAQLFVGDVDINQDEKIKIIEVLITSKMTSKSINVFVDYGQKGNFYADSWDNNASNQRIIDPVTKKEVRFASTAALLNFMEANGWQHYNSLALDEKGGGGFYYYFRRKV
jgi:hypothetical protein